MTRTSPIDFSSLSDKNYEKNTNIFFKAIDLFDDGFSDLLLITLYSRSIAMV